MLLCLSPNHIPSQLYPWAASSHMLQRFIGLLTSLMLGVHILSESLGVSFYGDGMLMRWDPTHVYQCSRQRVSTFKLGVVVVIRDKGAVKTAPLSLITTIN